MIHYPFELKHLGQQGRFTGYASVFRHVDCDQDVIQKGAFQTAISHFQLHKDHPKMLWQHDATTPIGKWAVLKEDAHGLYVEGQLFLDLPKGKEAYTLLKEGVVDSLSIGFTPVKSTPRAKGGREISEVILYEISLVTFPANEHAKITSIKQKGFSMTHQDLTHTLRELKETFDCFKTAQQDRLSTLEDRASQALLSAKRPGVSLDTKKRDHAFMSYVASGRPLETKALSTEAPARGGFLIPELIQDRILHHIELASPIRQVASTLSISSSAVDILLNKKKAEAGWIGETDERPTTEAPEIAKLKIAVHELYAKPRASQKLLDDAAIDVEEWLITKIGQRMAQMETDAFIRGNGENKPKGFLSYDQVDTRDHRWGNLEKIRTGAAGAFHGERGADSLIDVMQAMKSRYLQGSVWILGRSALSAIRKLRTRDRGDYLWQPGLGNEPATLLGHPIVLCDEMPQLAAGERSSSVVFANMKEAYQIVDRTGIHILRDPYSAKPYVEFYVTKRLGGDVVNFDALKVLSFEE